MRHAHKRLLMQFAISAAVAVATPAIAAGIVAGTSVAMQTGDAVIGNTLVPSDASPASVEQGGEAQQATHGPARLSVLAGGDQAAWDSAHSVHVDFSRPRPH